MNDIIFLRVRANKLLAQMEKANPVTERYHILEIYPIYQRICLWKHQIKRQGKKINILDEKIDLELDEFLEDIDKGIAVLNKLSINYRLKKKNQE